MLDVTLGDAATRDELLGWLGSKRAHVLGTVDGLADADLRSSRLPSGWTPLGAVQHLALDVERFWFRAVLGGDPADLPHGYEGWIVPDGTPTEEVLELYRTECERSDEVAASLDLTAGPRWWPEGEPADAPYTTLLEVLLHVLVETATHAGHLDIARELVDGRQRLVLDEPS